MTLRTSTALATALWCSSVACTSTSESALGPRRIAVTQGILGSSFSSQLSGDVFVHPSVAVGGMVRSRTLLGALVGNGLGGRKEYDASLVEWGGRLRVTKPNGTLRPRVDLTLGMSHADSTPVSPSTEGLLWGIDVGVTRQLGEHFALEAGLGYSQIDLDRGVGVEEDIELTFTMAWRF